MDPKDVLDFAKNQRVLPLRHSSIGMFSSPPSWLRLLFSIGVHLLLPSTLLSCCSSTPSLHPGWAKPREAEKESRKEKGGYSQSVCKMEQHLPHAGLSSGPNPLSPAVQPTGALPAALCLGGM